MTTTAHGTLNPSQELGKVTDRLHLVMENNMLDLTRRGPWWKSRQADRQGEVFCNCRNF